MTGAKKIAVDFEEIIKKGRSAELRPPGLCSHVNHYLDRERRQNQDLAQQIFSKDRRASGPGGGPGQRKPGSGPSLASRVGVTKVHYRLSRRIGFCIRI